MGFFTTDEKTLPASPSSTPRCGQCRLSQGCQSPKMQPSGQGLRKVLIVAEAPGKTEDEEGVQLVGEAGRLLRNHLKGLGWSLDRDCWKTNACTCRPPSNRTPSDTEIEACRPNLLKAVQELQPVVIVALGGTAVKSLLGHIWRDIGPIGKWVGLQVPVHRYGAWVCPTWHPSYLLRDKDNPALNLLFRQHLEAALGLREKPRREDHEWLVRREWSPEKASELIREEFIGTAGLVAFDYEVDRLKPDHLDARIVSCALSNGDFALAFPWTGEVVEATREFLWSKTSKVGWNIKFEERWTRKEFGKGVRNWLWDGMQAAHVLDNRPGITSLKFQGFVRLGVEPYDTTVSPYLRADSGNKANRITQVPLEDLLLYNGMDAMLTSIIGRQQMEEMGR